MRIAIEAQRIFRKDKHGMDFVILETLKELQKRKDGNEYYVFVAPGEDWCLEESENLHIIELRCPTYPLWEQIALPQAVRKLKADLLHCTSNTAPLWCPVPLVLTLHDIIYLEPRQHRSPSFYQEMGWHYRRLIVPRILKKARNIITVSQFECTRIREALQLPKEVIKAVYNGYSAYFTMQETPDESIVQKYIPHPDFLFFLGNTDPKKNAARTLKAYALYLKASQTKRPLLIADLKEEYIDQLLQQEGITGIKEHLYYPGYIGNKDLATLYNAAFAFLYPSLRESFGIPILEAMACGTPVVTGNVSAMPEVAGKGAILVDPQEPQKIADALLRLENDATLYQQQVEYGIQRSQLFSWRNTAESLLKDSGDALNSGTKSTLDGLSALLRRGVVGLNQTGTIRSAKNTLTDLIDDEWNSHAGEDNNVLLMDASAAPVSMTDARNANTTSIQFVMRTQEIKEGDAAKEEQTQEETAKTTFWQRVAAMFVDLWNFIKGIFGGKKD